MNIILWYKFYKNTVPFKMKHLLVIIPSLLPQKFLFGLFEKICSLKKAKKSEFVDAISYFGTSGVGKRKTSWYENVLMHSFSSTEIPIPNGYKEILEVMYGKDYMLPKQYSGDHGEVFFDTKHSYKEYINGTRTINEEQ